MRKRTRPQWHPPVEMRLRRFFDGRNWEQAFAKRQAERGGNP
jgi:hypothetical protein